LKEEIKAILFDKDGVLIDSFESCFTSFNETLTHYRRKNIPRERYLKNYWGNKAENNLQKLFNEEKQEKIKRILDHYASRREANIYLTKIYINTVPVLKKLENKYRLGIVTNTSKDLTMEILKKLNLLEYFDIVVTGDMGTPKPAPDLILKACEGLNVTTEQAVFLGDTEADVNAGKAARIQTLIIRSTLNKHLPKKYEDIIFIKDIADILNYVTV
jgi:HAD superfamily hydrolase (TIGR01509 family)